MNLKMNCRWTLIATVVLSGLLAGCQGTTALIPVADPDLKKSPPEFAADAAKRTYPATAPKGGEGLAQSEVDYFLNRIKLANLTDEDWKDVEIWVNQKYVCFIANWKAKDLKKVNFQMFYDNSGQMFPTALKQGKVELVEILVNGKLLPVAKRLAD